MPTPKRERKKQGRQARQEYLLQQQRRATRRRKTISVVVVAAMVAAFAAIFSTGGGRSSSATSSTSTSSTAPGATTTVPAAPTKAAFGTTPCPAADGSSARAESFPKPFAKCIDEAKTYTATIETDVGTMTAALDPAKAPVTVNNFVALARAHFFDGLTFHRVIPGFVLQGGDPKGDGTGDPGYKFGDELPAAGQYKVGSLAMANSGPNTNGSQFFVISGAQGVQLPPQYSLFGQVTDGLDVVKKIEADGDPSGKPKTVHKMVKVTIAES